MNCSVCNKNQAVVKCFICGNVVCKTCGVLCPSCQKPICRSHLIRLPDGKIACRSCAVTKQNIAVSHSPAKPRPSAPNISDKKEEKISLSFEDLASELGDIRIKVSDGPEREVKRGENKGLLDTRVDTEEKNSIENPFTISAEPQTKEEPPATGYKHLRRKPSDDPNEFRILTASSPKPTPIWVSGLISSILAFILSIPLVKNSQSPFFPPFFSYVVIFIAGGSIFWNGYGLFQSEETLFNRIICIPGILFSLIAIGIGIFFGLR